MSDKLKLRLSLDSDTQRINVVCAETGRHVAYQTDVRVDQDTDQYKADMAVVTLTFLVLGDIYEEPIDRSGHQVPIDAYDQNSNEPGT